MPSEAKALGNAWDRLTEGGYSGRQGYDSEVEAYGTRPGRSEARTSVHLRKCICQTAYSGNGLGSTDDNSPDAQERSEWKSFTLRFVAEAGAVMPPSTVTYVALLFV